MNEQDYFQIITEGTKRFLESYIKDSAFFINRFLVGYNKDKLRNTLKKYGFYDNQVTKFINDTKSYQTIDKKYIYDLYLFYEAMVNQEPSKEEIIVYRGCDTLEDRAMAGISATSVNKNIAKIFNYGTILKIHIPSGSKFIVCSEFVEDKEEQILLPPCDYEIIRQHMENIDGRSTRIVEINIKPRDILKDFSLAMQSPTQDYIEENGINQDYRDAFQFLYQIMIRRVLNVGSEELLKCTLDNIDDLSYPSNRKGIDAYSDILLINFMIKMKEFDKDYIIEEIKKEFYFISPQGQDCLLGIVTEYKEGISKHKYKINYKYFLNKVKNM